MFEHLGLVERYVIYRALLHAVQSNSGIGFHNSDQGHPAYRIGRDGRHDHSMWGDSPEHNSLFRMMHELSVYLNEQELECPTKTPYVFSWADFCRLATDAFDRQTAL